MIKSNERGPLALKADDTLLSNLSLVDSARKAIEDEIAKHSHAIVELKSRLNTFAPIARLPPELLSEIFVVCAIQYFELQERDIYYYGAPHYYSWIKVSHVCRHWRTVALNAPRLWCRIALTSRSAVKELLTRSKKAGLSIRADFRHSYSPLDERCKLLELAVEEIPRFKELSISCTARTLQGIFRMLARPAPLLQKLKISDPGNADLYYSYLPMLFSSETPSLYHLELRKVPIRWSNLILHSPLRHLVIVGRRDASVKPGGLVDVLTALDNLPMLETLELEDAISTLPPRRLNYLPSIALSLCLTFGQLGSLRAPSTVHISSAISPSLLPPFCLSEAVVPLEEHTCLIALPCI
ncbi:hypothetical protein A0H81_06123 [Grifola frondosa]|uniref:F-box domain-containing protein n=1 Tax=Grifola frondosa TaxID=5627 RepID=A0A1C7M9X8_GRIFR|nr:hypothetical protein A0H81_06123 [Grifola frondosa]